MPPESNKSTKRVLLILPGVTGCSGVNYVKDMVHHASMNGFQPVVVNSHYVKDEADMQDYRVLDFGDSMVMRASIDCIHEKMG